MPKLTAFIGRSFEGKEIGLWLKIKKHLDSLKDIGFEWEDGEKAQIRPISDKVKEKIQRNNIFIGILTKRSITCRTTAKLPFGYCLAQKDNWTTSNWIIQESGYAIGRDKKVVFMIENGLQIPGGLNADYEFVRFDADTLDDAFTTLNEIITSEIANRTPLASAGQMLEIAATTAPPPAMTESVGLPLLEEKPNFADVLAILDRKDFAEAEEKLREFVTDFKRPELASLVEIRFYKKMYFVGGSAGLNELKAIADRSINTFLSYIAIKAIVDCYERYDKGKEALKIVEAYVDRTDDYGVKFSLTVLASEVALRIKEIELAKEKLLPLLRRTGTNTSEQNVILCRTLGAAYKAEKKLLVYAALCELVLEYDPVNSIRFELAYHYGERSKHLLEAYHYSTYLKSEDHSTALNNLGVCFESLKLPGKAVDCFVESSSAKNTLAMANMARLYIEKGFYREAETILGKAREEKDYHENVDFYSKELKSLLEKEATEEKAIADRVRYYRDFAVDFARAVFTVIEDYKDLDGLWITDTEKLKEFRVIRVSSNSLTGKHEREYESSQYSNFALAPPPPPRSLLAVVLPNQKITFEGTLMGDGMVFSAEIDRGTILTSSKVSGIGIVISNEEIRFMADDDGGFTLFVAKKEKR